MRAPERLLGTTHSRVSRTQKAHPPPTRRGAVGKALRGLRVVGARGFEPPTFRSRTERATRLRHAPKSEGGFMPKLPSGVNGSSAVGEADPAERHVGDE